MTRKLGLFASSALVMAWAVAVGCADESSSTGEDTSGVGDGDGDGSGDGDGDGDGSGDGDGDGDGTGDGDGDGDGAEAKWDLGTIPDGSSGCADGGGGEDDFSYIWVANSSQGTISKIDTQTLEEEGRYIVRPDSAGSPSRTSVNLNGDVAVANRYGGITKVFADPEDCADTNGTPGIQTSSGSADILPWGEEECVSWYTAMAYQSQRPLAWDQGVLDEGSCTYENSKVWTASSNAAAVTVSRLNGDDGTVEVEIPVPEMTVGGYGPYGGAVDGDGNYWFMHRDTAPYPLARVDGQTLEYQIWDMPAGVNPYGFAIDPQGRPWIAGYIGGILRFDPETETFDLNAGVTGVGMMGDNEGLMWIAHYPWSEEGVSALDTETMELVDFVAVPSGSGKGVSIDFHGYVWLVDMTNSAFRIDPDTHDYLQYSGLTGPYTYSDMTGFGLASVTNPQG